MPKRSEAPLSMKQEGDHGENKKRVRKIEDGGRRNSQKLVDDVLESSVLTKQLWDELYEIFKKNFSTEMPFLHPPTFRNRMRQAAFPRDPSISPAEFESGRVLLLGVLTLTARFHPTLVTHHSPDGNPQAASEYYAVPLAAAFGPTIRNLTNPSLENVQALLMLGLYEWGQTRGLSAWLYVGLAIRLAFSMGLAFEDDPDSRSLTSSANGGSKSLTSSREDSILLKEIRRRTLWSCFIMDRMLAAGKYRPTMMSVEKLRVQLPCSDRQFLFVSNVHTGYLNKDWDTPQGQHGAGSEDGVLGRYIRLVEIFGRFSEWSYAGGRRTEKHPPWDESTEFFKLRRQLQEFHDSLPSHLTFTEANLSAHIEQRNATTYASMHTLYFLCLIVLHREYIPFIPLRCEGPEGPLDEPTFPPSKFNVPSGFWRNSAEQIMKASRDIIEIVNTCQENNALPESPQIGFAVWQAAFVCVYAHYFPQMDTEKHLVNPGRSLGNDSRKSDLPALTTRILSDMVPRLKMVKGYLRSIQKMHSYFHGVKQEFYGKFKRRPMQAGGGLEQYKMYEKELKEFGELRDVDHISNGSEPLDHNRSRASTNDLQGSVNGEPMQGVEGPQRANGQWAPINASSPPREVEERPKYPQAPYGYQMPYQHSPNPSSSAPSLISPSNGGDSSGLNSPYPNQNQYPSNTQSQQSGIYPSIAQHTMAPPTANMGYAPPPQADELAYEKWIGEKESIRMNTGLDNFSQEAALENWAQYNGGLQQAPDFLQATWAPMTTGPAWS